MCEINLERCDTIYMTKACRTTVYRLNYRLLFLPHNARYPNGGYHAHRSNSLKCAKAFFSIRLTCTCETPIMLAARSCVRPW